MGTYVYMYRGGGVSPFLDYTHIYSDFRENQVDA